MKNSHLRQRGSALSTLLIVAVLAYGVFVALQYAPLYIQSSAVDSILSSIHGKHKAEPFKSVSEVESQIDTLLNVNQIKDMREYFKVETYLDDIRIDVSYNRDLNLLFQQKIIRYEKQLVLNMRS